MSASDELDAKIARVLGEEPEGATAFAYEVAVKFSQLVAAYDFSEPQAGVIVLGLAYGALFRHFSHAEIHGLLDMTRDTAHALRERIAEGKAS